jgi:hypothetical protein
VRLPDNTFKGFIGEQVEFGLSGDLRSNIEGFTQSILDSLQGFIEEYPDQWAMRHKLWSEWALASAGIVTLFNNRPECAARVTEVWEVQILGPYFQPVRLYQNQQPVAPLDSWSWINDHCFPHQVTSWAEKRLEKARSSGAVSEPIMTFPCPQARTRGSSA